MNARYASLNQANSEIIIESQGDEPDTSGDDEMLEALRFTSARADEITSRTFAPIDRTRRFHAYGSHIDEAYNALYLGSQPILEIQSLVVGGVELEPYDEEEGTGDYFFLEDESPFFNICLSSNAQARWSNLFNGEWRNSIRVTGTWGYRSHYPMEGWLNSGATVNENPLTISDAVITVSSVAAFSPGQMIRIGTEYMEVLAVDGLTLTVTRGWRGSTAATHAQNAQISIWIPEPPITRAILRWAAFLYRRRGNFQTLSLDTAIGAVVSKYPPDAPEEIQNILDLYTDWTPRTPE